MVLSDEKKEVRFTLRIVPELDAKLTQESERRGVSKNNLIVNILWNHAEEKEKNKCEH